MPIRNGFLGLGIGLADGTSNRCPVLKGEAVPRETPTQGPAEAASRAKSFGQQLSIFPIELEVSLPIRGNHGFGQSPCVGIAIELSKNQFIRDGCRIDHTTSLKLDRVILGHPPAGGRCRREIARRSKTRTKRPFQRSLPRRGVRPGLEDGSRGEGGMIAASDVAQRVPCLLGEWSESASMLFSTPLLGIAHRMSMLDLRCDSGGHGTRPCKRYRYLWPLVID
jgi:hypothetical protein